MLIDLNSDGSIVEVNETFEVDRENLKNTDIKGLSKIKIEGIINKLDENLFDINISVSGTMTLLCVLSLEEVEYPFNIKIRNTIENSTNSTNALDIFPIVWENIVLEIPSRVVKENVNIKTHGEGWNLITEDNLKKMEEEE